MRIFRHKKQLPEKPVSPLTGGTGYIAVELMDGRHYLLSETVRFMVNQEQAHADRLGSLSFRQYLDERVLDLERIYENDLYGKIERQYGKDGVLRENFVIKRIGTYGWLTQSDEFYTHRLEVWADAETSSGKRMRLEGYALCEGYEVSYLHFDKVTLDGERKKFSVYVMLGSLRSLSLSYGDFNILLAEEMAAMTFDIAETFVSRFKAIRKFPYKVVDEKKGLGKACYPFEIGERDVFVFKDASQTRPFSDFGRTIGTPAEA